MRPRYFGALALALAVTFGLFWLMQFLISMEGGGLDEGFKGSRIEFVRLKRDSELELKKRKMPDKKPPEEPPPPPDINMDRSQRPDLDAGDVIPIMDTSVNLAGGPFLGAPSDADIIPLVRVAPQYPPRAAQRGLEGWVELEFTITEAGTVKNPVVIATSSAVFNRAAVRAIRKWKYKPKIVDGVAVERPGVKVRLTFELEDV